MDKKQRNRAAILGALHKIGSPANSVSLTQFLSAAGHNLSERTVRLYLSRARCRRTDRASGQTQHDHGKRADRIARRPHAFNRVGYLSAKIDQMAYSMTFDMVTRTGLVVVNMSLVDPRHLAACQDDVRKVFARGYAMGSLLALLPPGESLGEWTVPPDKLGFCTVCSITLNGVLMKHGVPTTSRFGGLLELRDGRPTRFVEMIHYDGTSIDPLEVFIRSGMTDYLRGDQRRQRSDWRRFPRNAREQPRLGGAIGRARVGHRIGRLHGDRLAGPTRPRIARDPRPHRSGHDRRSESDFRPGRTWLPGDSRERWRACWITAGCFTSTNCPRSSDNISDGLNRIIDLCIALNSGADC